MGIRDHIRDHLLWTAGQIILNAVLPRQCPMCGTPVDQGGGLCTACFSRITWLGSDVCALCGLPVWGDEPPLYRDGKRICPVCAEAPPPCSAARSALVYNQASRDILLRFKHADQTHLSPILARWLWRVGAPLMDPNALIVPVPLHRTRLRSRRYNQSALLARDLARLAGCPFCPDVLHRCRKTVSQGTFDHHGGPLHGRLGPSGEPGNRWQNVHGAFAVQRPQMITRRPVVLVDDVMTSGATVHECSRVLLEAGADSVVVLTVARALPPGLSPPSA